MRVLFDHQAFELQTIGGVSRSYAEIISHLRSLGCDCPISIKESDNIYLKEKKLESPIYPLHYHHNLLFGKKQLFNGQRYLTRKLLKLLGYSNDCWNFNRDLSIKRIKNQQFDIFEPTFFDSYFLPYLKEKPFVLTVHDMIPEVFPEYFPRDDFQIVQKRELCHLAAHIHVPSQKTKEDLINILNIKPENVSVIYHGAPFFTENENYTKNLFDFPYLLYVGDRYGYKNFAPWLRSAQRVINDYPDIHIVCTGKSFNSIELRLIDDLHLNNNVHHFFANQESLSSLYHNAIAFVYPSEYEGFGLPILEAFTYECPVMLNASSCFPEVGGDAVIYFNQKRESSDFYDKFQTLLLMSSKERSDLIERGKARLLSFSWEKAAKQLLSIYSRLA